ncbi:M23 family metallopeptidase [bacterium]|nr:M23 family metallopeptidase [bacterium]
MIESKFYKENKTSNNFFKKIILRILVTTIIALILLISFKMNSSFKKTFYHYVYEENFPFSVVKNFLQDKFGTSLTFDKLVTEEEVFNEKLSYKDKSLYHDGVKLTVSSEYMIPSFESGIVVYIGQKENYKQVVIVQQMNGVDVWYGNIKQANVKLYDYVEKGSLIGQADNKTLYLVFQKEGKFIDYQKYLAKS